MILEIYCSNLTNYFSFQILNFIKAPTRIRYCQWTLEYSIVIQGRRPTIYRFIREHDLLTVPSQNTIVTYPGTTKGEVGITNVNLSRLKMIVDCLTQQHEKRVSVEIDEMACKSLLLWIQSRQQFVGEVDFGRVIMDDRHLNEVLENEELDDEDEEETVGRGLDVDGGKISENTAFRHDDHHVQVEGPPLLANSLINFVVKGKSASYKITVIKIDCSILNRVRRFELLLWGPNKEHTRRNDRNKVKSSL